MNQGQGKQNLYTMCKYLNSDVVLHIWSLYFCLLVDLGGCDPGNAGSIGFCYRLVALQADGVGGSHGFQHLGIWYHFIMCHHLPIVLLVFS